MRIKIKEARIADGLKQKELSAMVGLSQPYFAQIERGERRLTASLQAQIAKAIGVKPTDLVDFDAPTEDDEQFLIETFRGLSPERREGWLDMARTIAAQKAKPSEETQRGPRAPSAPPGA